MRLPHCLAAAFLIAAVTEPAIAAENFPLRPVRVIVPFSPGGQADMFARLVSQKAGEALGQQMVIDNRAGAGGLVGTRTVAEANPDGYTLLSSSSSHTILPVLYKSAYDPRKDFAGISMIYSAALLLAVPAATGAKSVQDLITQARTRPGQINMASAGVGSGAHLAGEIFNRTAGITVVHVPYKGIPEAVADLIAGRVQMYMIPIAPAAPLVKDGRIRALGVTSLKRSPVFPEIPTIDESGLKDYVYTPWAAMFAPARTPQSIVARLNRVVNDALRLPEVEKSMRAVGVEPAPSTPVALERFVAADAERVRVIAREAGLKPE